MADDPLRAEIERLRDQLLSTQRRRNELWDEKTKLEETIIDLTKKVTK